MRVTWPILRPGRGLGLAVEVDARRRGIVGGGRGLVAEQVQHLRVGMPAAVAERPAADRADVLLELVDQAGVLGPVAGVVHPGGDLVDQEAGAA